MEILADADTPPSWPVQKVASAPSNIVTHTLDRDDSTMPSKSDADSLSGLVQVASAPRIIATHTLGREKIRHFTPHAEAAINGILSSMRVYFDVTASIESVREIVAEAYRTTDAVYTLDDALQYAAGFKVPQDILDRDYRLFQAHGRNFEQMVQRRLRSLLPDRLNRDRIAAHISIENPDRAKLCDLVEGMTVHLPPGFRPNGVGPRPPLRMKYRQAHTVVNKLYHEMHSKGLAVYLPIDVATTEVVGSHFSMAHWTPQKDKVQGRQLIDSSDDSIPDSVLNGESVREQAEQFYGAIQHPTITSLMQMILRFYHRARQADPTVTWDDICLWKMDLKGAYTLLSFRPSDVKLFGMELTNDDESIAGQFAIFFLSGIFGWTETPYAFQVVTRAIVYELRKTTSGDLDMFVDDIMGVCLRRDSAAEIATADRLCRGLLGPDAVAQHKTLWGQRLDWIGYAVDSSTQRVTISKKNFLNALYGFFTVNIARKVPVRVIERLASWGSRYSLICRYMRPFNRALYSNICMRKAPDRVLPRNISVDLTPAAKRAICLWRAMLIVLRLDEDRFARSFESFHESPSADYIGEFDSSLEGSAALIFKTAAVASEESSAATETILGGGAVSLASLAFEDDSSHQNTSEFIGAILVVMTLHKLGIRNPKVMLRGDSITALTWASEERFRGDLVTNASIVFILLMIATGTEIVSQHHIPGEDNWRCDGLSRPSLGKTAEELGLSGVRLLSLTDDPDIAEILQLCDPRCSIDSEDDFSSFWRRVNGVVQRV
jgi:hypothetical protein